MRLPILILSVAMIVPLLAGCAWVVAGGAVVGVNAARQERSVGDALDDIRIKTEIQSDLIARSANNFVNVSVTVVEGRVLLTGRVKEPEQRLDATRVAWGTDGVLKVDNDIEVTEDAGWLERPNDILIRTTLAGELLADPEISDINYTIDCVNGVVYLMGVGQNREEVQRVIAHARGVSGVRRVENYVVLKNHPLRVGTGLSDRES
ncbi:MAG: BON domain-containing protein [Alphaproteobacteria bacterium]